MRASTQSLPLSAVRSFFACVLLTLLCLPAARAATSGPFSYLDLINRLTDLEHLATLPEQGEKCAQWSSWDRRSRCDEASGRYIDWDPNGDNNGIIRREGNEQVMAEMEGPGVIWRIWSALPKEGHVKIYLDGAAEPAVDLPFIGYFGYAWCDPTLFENCYHNQTISMNNRGHVCVNRWHVTDNIPFQRSFEAAIEKYYANSKPTLYAATAY